MRHWQKVLGCAVLLILLCCARGYSFGALMVFHRHRAFFYNEESPVYAVEQTGDFSNESLAPYTVGDSTFVLSVRHYSAVAGDDLKDDMASASYYFIVYTKKQSDFSYQIKSINVITSEYQKDIEGLIYELVTYSGQLPEPPGRYGTQTEFREWEKNRDYRRSILLGGDFVYPRPKDMKVSIDVEVEVADGDAMSVHVFRYHYTMTKKNRWIYMYGV